MQGNDKYKYTGTSTSRGRIIYNCITGKVKVNLPAHRCSISMGDQLSLYSASSVLMKKFNVLDV